MGLIKDLVAKTVGSKKSEYAHIIGSDARVARQMRRDAKVIKKIEDDRTEYLKLMKLGLKQLSSNNYLPEHVQEIEKTLERNSQRYIKLAKKEIQTYSHLMVGVQALYYRLKEVQIAFLRKDIAEILQVGFPEKLHDNLYSKYKQLINLHMKQLSDLEDTFRKEFKGRFSLQAVTMWSERHLAKVVIKDTKQVRKLIKEIEDLMEGVQEEELLGKVESTYKMLDKMMNNIKTEMDELQEIAVEDIKIVHKLSTEIKEIADNLQKARNSQNEQFLRKIIAEFDKLFKFEHNTIQLMFKSQRRAA